MKLLLAVDIADRVNRAAEAAETIDFDAEADALIARHPEAHISHNEVVAVLIEEIQAFSGDEESKDEPVRA
ncbi:hypothetical protein [Devosia nitrariae]|uniref:Uncharacterized protein n=1 Tax=Devosia nitrariae TaxID=2071872 RepID=A0ABQ5WBZ0_9HYPH|nr:hypothetical protein [Devosia nitrariae]GLQ57269.1 hypothetical protein GCM10010862_45280 [Devosia nitrariae]